MKSQNQHLLPARLDLTCDQDETPPHASTWTADTNSTIENPQEVRSSDNSFLKLDNHVQSATSSPTRNNQESINHDNVDSPFSSSMSTSTPVTESTDNASPPTDYTNSTVLSDAKKQELREKARRLSAQLSKSMAERTSKSGESGRCTSSPTTPRSHAPITDQRSSAKKSHKKEKRKKVGFYIYFYSQSTFYIVSENVFAPQSYGEDTSDTYCI